MMPDLPSNARHPGTSDIARALLDELLGDPAAVIEFRRLLAVGPAVYTCTTLAAELGCTPRAVRAAIERGDLAAVRSGRGWLIASEAVAAWATPVAARPRRARQGSTARTLRDAFGD